MRSNRILVLLGVLLLGFGFAYAQRPQPDIGKDILSFDIDVVNVQVVVTDPYDDPISGLQREHFRLFVDDREHVVTYFQTDEEPLTAVLLLEFRYTSGFQWHDVAGPAMSFISSFRKDDWAAVVTYDIRPVILIDFTKDKHVLLEGLDRLSIDHPTYRVVRFYDAVYDVLERLENVDGKKAVFLLSTGQDRE